MALALIDTWASALQSTDFELVGYAVTRAEWWGALLSLMMVVCNARLSPWGWPLAFTASALYGMVFWSSRLYGQAALQGVFALMAVWGLWQWIRPRTDPQADEPRSADGDLRWRLLAITAVLWLALGAVLASTTDNPAPYADALPTAGSLVATWMLARKYHENWPVWLAVNVCAAVLFVQQGLGLTAALYGCFALLSAWGWWTWRARSIR